MERKNEYEWLDPGVFRRHPLHQKSLLNPEEKKQTGYAESLRKYGKLRPVLYVEPFKQFLVDGVTYEPNKKYVVDGWGGVTDAMEQKLPYVLALKVEAETEEEIMQVIAEANSTYHTSYRSLYKLAKGLFDVHSKGQGYRSDKEEKDAEVDDENSDSTEVVTPNKKLTTYEKIGKMMGGLPGTRIKHLLLVGRVNPLFLESMDTDRVSLYAAYLQCKKEQSGVKPEPPTAKQPNYYASDTGTPQQGESTPTEGTMNGENNAGSESAEPTPEALSNSEEESSQHQEDDEMGSTNSAEAPVFIIVKGRCLKCGVETAVEIDINQLKNIKL